MNKILKNIATLGFVGYLPVAPGTWGSLVSAVFVAFLDPSSAVQAILIVIGFVIGTISSTVAERVIGQTDSGHIVIDEFIGFLVSVVYLPQTYGYIIAAFFLFRFFDILKPFPIKKIESVLSGGKGIMADDIMAAIYTNLILQMWQFIH
jgi:phosphatidylglycerophosphatase A